MADGRQGASQESWAAERPSSRAYIGRFIDYIFGRNTLIGVASLMLLFISGYATWHGMADFIIGASTRPGQSGRDLPGGLSVTNDFLVIAIVVALTFLMWLALREAFGARRRFTDRVVMGTMYAFLFLWSIGFGYGFWWALIAGEEATRISLAGLQEDARDAGGAVAARLDAVRIQLDNVVSWSDSQMSREETSGGSCGVASGAGRGPLYNARRSVRDGVSSLRDNVVNSWLTPVQDDLQKLRLAAAAQQGATLEERQRQFEAAAADIRGRARSIASRSNELGRSTAAEMRALARTVAVAPGQPGFQCHDPTLAQRLEQAAKQAEEPAILKLRSAVFTEGPAGVANAVKNLWGNVTEAVVAAFRYIFTGGKRGWSETADTTPLSGRDVIALLATLGVDLGLLALAILNPPKEPPPVRPSGSLIRQINEAIETAIARAPGADIEWLRKHFVHHNKHSYFVIPNLYNCDPENPDEASKALAVNQLAGVFSDLELVRWPPPKELRTLLEEEKGSSTTDLTEIRKKWARENKFEGEDLARWEKEKPIRNHGLYSKAERALQIAGWSAKARRDIEVFKLIEADGLTPLLMVLSQARGGRSHGAHEPPAKRAAAPDPATITQ